MELDTLRSPLTVLCGKGGVGKTTLSLALGLWHAGFGRKVVVVTSHPLSELAVSISLQGLKESHPAAAANLFIVHIDPREILGNKVRQQIPSEFLCRAVMSSRLYQNLVEVAPGLKEIAFLARLRQLAERRVLEGQVEGYELMIWDAPATGHFLQTLRVSRNFDTYMSGPFAVLGRELTRFLSDPRNIRLVPVTILEEMPVEETIEMCGDLEKDLNMPPSAVLCNLASPLLSAPDAVYRELDSLAPQNDSGAGDLRMVLDRHAAERDLFTRLRQAVNVPLHIVQRVTRWTSDLELLQTVGNTVGTCLSDGAQ